MQLSIFDIIEEPQNLEVKNELKEIIPPDITKDLQEETNPKEVIVHDIKYFTKENEIILVEKLTLKLFEINIRIKKENNSYYTSCNYSYKTGTYEGCSWGYHKPKEQDIKKIIDNLFNYFIVRISHIEERSDTNKEQKETAPIILNWLKERHFYYKNLEF